MKIMCFYKLFEDTYREQLNEIYIYHIRSLFQINLHKKT